MVVISSPRKVVRQRGRRGHCYCWPCSLAPLFFPLYVSILFSHDIGFHQEHGVVEFQISFFVVMRSFVVRCPRKSGGRIGSVRQFASMLRDVVVDDLN